jgi:ABC-type transport system involved in multi-copper enzyme maturation permease subunit
MGLLLAAFSFLFSTLFTNQILAMVVTFLLFFAGLELSPVKELALSSEYVSAFNKALIKLLYYFFPNFSLYDLKAPVVHTQLSLSLTYFILLPVYTLLYSGAVLLLTSTLFKRREL